MTFPGRRLSLTRNNNREGRESLLINSERNHRSYNSGGSSSGGSDAYEVAAAMKGRMAGRTPSLSPVNSRLAPQHRFLPQHGANPTKAEISPDEGVLQFVPAFDESQTSSMPDSSWDAILNEGAAAFPQGTKSEIARKTSGNRFRRKAQSTVGHSAVTSRRRESDAASSISTSRSKGPRIARLASLFTGSGSTSKPTITATTTTTSHNAKKYAPHNTTDATLPSSPSRSSSSGGYVGWPGTQDRQGRTVAIHSSYEESESGPCDPPAKEMPYGKNYEDERERQEMQEWMQSPAFQDISAVVDDPDVSGMTLPVPPSPPGEKADDSLYFQSEPPTQNNNNNTKAIHMNQLFQNHSGWEVGSSPSRSSFSKNSSAFFDNDVRPMAFPAFEGERRKQAAAGVMRGVSTTPQPPTEEALALNNSFSPPQRTFHAEASRGYRGLIDKTHEVPNLMDAMDSDSLSSNVPSSTASGPPGAYNGNIRQSGLMPRVREEDYMTRDSESDVFDEISKYSIGESELFEGISQSDSKQSSYQIRDSNPFEGMNRSVVQESKASLQELRNTTSSVEKRHRDNSQGRAAPNGSNVKVVLLGGGLTTIQTSNADFSNRISASDFDECLTNSDIDEYGHTKLPSFQEMAAAGRSPADNASVVDVSMSGEQSLTSREKAGQSFASFGPDNFQNEGEMIGQNFSAFENENHPHSRRSITGSDHGYKDDESAFFSDFYSADEVGFDGDLSEYYVQPSMVKKLVRGYRKMCRITMANCRDYDELDRTEDEKKVFALFEMRSRIMEKDIERGLERRGGTSVVDDLVMTPSNRRAMRVRDAVIVSKAWRDGASPIDVINTAHLTQRDQRSYFIKRPILATVNQRGIRNKMPPRYRWEEVAWVDDTDFMQYRCPSLGARSLRGAEMFTIGDCQSILLKLTNEACIELREDLNDATARQIEAEELMKEEGDYGDGIMTASETLYLSAMEEVKTISRQLVVAEKAFALVRDRIRNLVAKYEALLVKIDDEEMATSSVITADSSCFSEEYGSRVSTDYDEELAWHRRQQRAEVSAELAAREALLAKQSEARAIQEEKHRELRELQARLAELQSEPSTTTTDRQRSAVLAKAIAARHQSSKARRAQQNDSRDNQSNVEGVKQRFRDRMAARLRQKNSDVGEDHPDVTPASNRYFMREHPKPVATKAPSLQRQKLIRLAGEEMFSHLDFYQRSLDAVQSSREGVL